MIFLRWILASIGFGFEAGLVALAAYAVASSQAFRAHGPLYPVAEPNLLTAIENAAADDSAAGRAADVLAQARQRAVALVAEPTPIAGLVQATKPTVRIFDPSITVLSEGIKQRINPLDHVALDGRLLLFDATEPAQNAIAINLLRRSKGRIRPILVAGKPDAIAQRLGVRTYFDQQGALSKRLAITELPALVSQQDRFLRIESLVPAPGP